MASKSDVPAKIAYKKRLEAEGYTILNNAKSTSSDIVATKDGETWYFEIKMTRKTDVYFGAATLTEWEQAFKTPDRYFFVVAIMKPDGSFEFRKYTPNEFMKFSTIPPFKIFFTLDLINNKLPVHRTALELNKERFNKLNELFKAL